MELRARHDGPALDWATMLGHRQLTLLLDLDGTLIPFADSPAEAQLDSAGVKVLAALHNAGVQVVIVSGRPLEMLTPLRILAPHAWWAAEHGTWRCDDRGCWTGPSNTPELVTLAAILEAFARVPGARMESKSLSVCLHWRQVPDALKAELIRGAELVCDEWLESEPAFERLAGVEMLEVRRRSANKGGAVAWVRQRIPGAHFIAIGDDETDEDMFAALRHDELAIGVGARHPSRSSHKLPSLAAVRAFLWWLVEARRGGIAAQPFGSLERRTELAGPRATRLLMISNRTPSAVTGKQRAVGGLVSALEPVLRTHGGVWLGWSGHTSESERALILDRDQPLLASFDLSEVWRERFYGGFCNRALWPLFHGFTGRVSYADADWEAYVDANAEFARHAVDLVGPHTTVWVHDYQLLLTGRALRERGFRGPLGLFLHIPFPPSDLFDTLPWADQLIAAIGDYDLIGVHTEQWATNLRTCLAARLSVGHRPVIAVLPIGVDPEAFQPGKSPPDPEVAGLRAALGARRIILGVDRLDHAKGIPERLTAFERLLELRPEWRGQVCLVQISVPSREDVPEYAELRHRVETLVGRINGKYGEADWVPVRYLYRSYAHGVLAQLYRAADVALVTPLRDGLNLVAKEFVVAQDPARPGVLMLSRFAGAAAELVDAVITNPYHPDGMALDLDRALRMDLAERQQRFERMAATLAGRTPAEWARAFLDRLASAAGSRGSTASGVKTGGASPSPTS
ncbi:MAG: trehalose-phosphatase [Kofleriaceae bacterium]